MQSPDGEQMTPAPLSIRQVNCKRACPAPTFVGGAGVALGLPMADGNTPGLAAADKPVKRFSIVYVPNGRIMEKWTPAAEGASFELPPLLEPFAPFRDRMLVV